MISPWVGGILLVTTAFLGAIRAEAGDGESQDMMTLYLRSDFRNNQPNIVTLNGIYDWNSPWGTLELGSRIGGVGSQFGLWSYKLEAFTPHFWGRHRASVRVVKNNEVAGVTSQNTRIVERIQGAYHPFESMDLLSALDVDLETGLAQNFMNAPGTNVLPNGNGALNLVPIWALKVKIPQDGTRRHFSLSYSNFDVFDPYPASQPFLQAEISDEIDETRVYGYVRYRWDYAITNFYSLYVALGLELPH